LFIGDTYDYSKVVYKHSKSKVIVICKSHGDYLITPNDHISKESGCFKCGLTKRTGSTIKVSFSERVNKLNELFGNTLQYTYISSNLIGVTCVYHGYFIKNVQDFKKSTGCSFCYKENQDKERLSKFYNEQSQRFSNIMVNTVLEDISSKYDQIVFKCSFHGLFTKSLYQFSRSILGCPSCTNLNTRTTQDEFIIKANKIHKGKYNYSQVSYTSCKEPISIVCPVHGVFTQTPDNHLSKRGCRFCTNIVSTPEIELYDFIKSIFKDNVQIVQSYRPSWLLGKELDLFIPSLNLAIEYNGNIFHNSRSGISAYLDRFVKPKDYHFNKWSLCKDNDIQLISIYEYLWITYKDIYYKQIKFILNKNNHMFTQIQEITIENALKFYSENYLYSKNIDFTCFKSFGIFQKNQLVNCFCLSSDNSEIGHLIYASEDIIKSIKLHIKTINKYVFLNDLYCLKGSTLIEDSFVPVLVNKGSDFLSVFNTGKSMYNFNCSLQQLPTTEVS
jgi:thiol-disulfide isomerase/thioredoxin